MASDYGAYEPLRTILRDGRTVPLRLLNPANQAALGALPAGIGSTLRMTAENPSNEYLEILGIRVQSVDEGVFLAFIESNNGDRQWTQQVVSGCGIHSAFLASDGPWGFPITWKDHDGPGRSARVWGGRGLAPRENVTVWFQNLQAGAQNVRAEFICRTVTPVYPGALPMDMQGLQAVWDEWLATFETMRKQGIHGDARLFLKQGIFKFVPLWDANANGAVVNPAVAGFGSILVPANGESGPIQVTFPATKEGLVVFMNTFATSTGNFEYQLSGGGWDALRDENVFVSSGGPGGFQQWGAARTFRNKFVEVPFASPRPYNVSYPPTVTLRDLSGAPNNIRLGFGAISIPRKVWAQGGGSR